MMSVEVGGRTLRSRSRGTSVAKTNSNVGITANKKSVSYEESREVAKTTTVTSYASSSLSLSENGTIDKQLKEKMNKSMKKTEKDGGSGIVGDKGGIITGTTEFQDGGGGYSSDDSGGDSPWQNGQFKSPEEVLSYYKRFGDWWNYFPKTDNAYNPTSEWYGQEVAPGIPVIPNMARPPLRPISWQQKQYVIGHTMRRNLTKDALFAKSNGTSSVAASNSRIKNWFLLLTSVITTTVTTIWTSVSSIVSFKSNRNSHLKSESNIQDDAVVVEGNSWTNFFYGWLYRLSAWLFMQEVFIFSRMHNNFSKNKVRKKSRIYKFLVFLLIPLLILLLGYYRMSEPSGENYAAYVLLPAAVDYSSVYDSSINYFKLIPSYFADFYSYFYGLLPVFSHYSISQYFSSPKVVLTSATSHGTIDDEKLSIIVQQMVRETLKKDTAVLLEDIVNNPRFKLLMEKAVADKADSVDLSSFLSSEQWRVAVREIVEDHYNQNNNMESIDKRFKIIENKVNLNADEILKLQGSSMRLEEKFLVLEKSVHSLVKQFVTHQQLEEAIKNLTLHLYSDVKLDEKLMAEKIKSDVTVKVQEEVTYLFKTLLENKHQVEDLKGEINLDQLKDYVKSMIDRALALYDADKTGRVDYALESSGGNVISTRCTESYSSGQPTYQLFGIALWRRSNSPRTIIQPGVHPGECWAFAGQQGYIVLQLSATILVTAFTVEHIPRSLAPQERIDSAPKDFSVWGLKYETDMAPTFLGRFRFMENGTSLQKFDALPQEEPFRLVELIIESNHGNLEYTCLYRFRVHGVPVS